jgi:hypothetical protein
MPALGATLVRGALAGAVAGLIASVVAYLWVEPVLDRAIALEGATGAGPVSRETQKLLGMPIGFVLTGVALGLIFALVWRVLPTATTPWRRSVGLGVAAFLALAAVPQLRYPANPPGVGDPGTLADRTGGYLLAVALGVVVVSGAYAALRALARRGWPEPTRQAAVAVGAVAVLAVGYLLLPDSGDAVDVPASLVWDFRVRSLAVLALLYLLLGAVFGALTERSTRAVPVPV